MRDVELDLNLTAQHEIELQQAQAVGVSYWTTTGTCDVSESVGHSQAVKFAEPQARVIIARMLRAARSLEVHMTAVITSSM